MAKDYSQVNFRIPTKLKEQIELAAKNNERSITSELVARLEHSIATFPKSIPSISQDLMETTSQTVAKEVIEGFINALKNDQIEGVRIIIEPSKKPPEDAF